MLIKSIIVRRLSVLINWCQRQSCCGSNWFSRATVITVIQQALKWALIYSN